MKQQALINQCNEWLRIGDFNDYCPNGLQVAGDDREVRKIALGVSISEELIALAIKQQADLILTHHGLFWNKDSRVIQGPMQRKLKLLLGSGIASAAYHLPLDFHATLGNNLRLAEELGLQQIQGILNTPKYAEGMMGTTDLENIEALGERIETVLHRKPLLIPYGPKLIKKVAIVTGGAQGYFLQAIEAGADCFITGEASEQNYSMSKEYGVHFISAGHYQTERFGIQALGAKITQEFGIACEFMDFPNPI